MNQDTESTPNTPSAEKSATARDGSQDAWQKEAILTVEGLEVSYGETPVLHSASFTLARGERLAVVGESGSGKSTMIAAVLGLLPPGGRMTQGSIRFRGNELTEAGEAEFSALRGRSIALIPQDPMTNLNPSMRVGDQIADALRTYGLRGRSAVTAQVEQLMEEAGIEQAARRRRQFPHEFSGGMRQRTLIAMALAGEPELIVADEPTSALDVTVQKQILDHLQTLVERRGMGLLFVTHDLGVAADRTDTILVMSRGEIMERGAPGRVLSDPQHEYTATLVAAAPRLTVDEGCQPGSDGQVGRGTQTAADAATTEPEAVPVLSVRDLTKEFPLRGQRGVLRAVDEVSFSVAPGTTTAIIGESGSGKSTVASMVLGLTTPTSGEVVLSGSAITGADRVERRRLRRFAQPVFQDPYTSLNPFWRVEQIIAEPLRLFKIDSRAEQRNRVRSMLDQVALPRDVLSRHPGELSGGQRQRVAIARALISEPEMLICDEAVSALDVVVQAQVLDLLRQLRTETGVSCLFITHDLAVTADFADRVVVMNSGHVVESGPVSRVIREPQEEYTRALLAAVPGSELVGV